MSDKVLVKCPSCGATGRMNKKSVSILCTCPKCHQNSIMLVIYKANKTHKKMAKSRNKEEQKRKNKNKSLCHKNIRKINEHKYNKVNNCERKNVCKEAVSYDMKTEIEKLFEVEPKKTELDGGRHMSEDIRKDREIVAGWIFYTACQVAFSDKVWQAFGFSKLPKCGRLFRIFISSQQLAEEDFMLKELLVFGLLIPFQHVSTCIEEKDKYEILGRALEITCIGLKGDECLWKTFEFPSLVAAKKYISEGLIGYWSPNIQERTSFFTSRSVQVASTSTQVTWLLYASLFFENFGLCLQAQKEEFPLDGLTGQTNLKDNGFADLAHNILNMVAKYGV